MPLKIKSIETDSLADQAGFQDNETILSINGMPIRDFLDLEHYSSDFRLEFELLDQKGSIREITIYRKNSKPLGITPVDYRHRKCKNHCIFCFIDQMPPGMRKTLYAKDDDYIFSYVYGNYITLTNLQDEDKTRICDQHISPLYVSLHTSDVRLRKEMMRSPCYTDPIAILKQLSECGIAFHIQLVLVPGFNDQTNLKNTILDLQHPALNILSIGVVPVGLTKFRDNLYQLEPFTKDSAAAVLDLLREIDMFTEIDNVYAADEFYVLAQEEIPEYDDYGDFPQIENGIGMLRYSAESFQAHKRKFLKELRLSDKNYHFISSKSASTLMEKIVKQLSKRLPERLLTLQVIRNDFFGEHISVAGLITAGDILSQIEAPEGSTLVLPASIFNYDGLTLDNISIEQLKHELQRDLLVVDPLWEDWQRY
jgi:putative radical SAM enzyme (TIGR03279 family)